VKIFRKTTAFLKPSGICVKGGTLNVEHQTEQKGENAFSGGCEPAFKTAEKRPKYHIQNFIFRGIVHPAKKESVTMGSLHYKTYSEK
jgi:hypothetical protein